MRILWICLECRLMIPNIPINTKTRNTLKMVRKLVLLLEPILALNKYFTQMYKILITNIYIFKYLISIVLLGSVTLFLSNGKITLNNPSFEDTPSDATTPMGWFECTPYTTPDILPGFWGVYNEPSDGDTYIGMITRENRTWEAIGQRVSNPMTKDACYQFTIDLAHSNSYAGYNDPVRLSIWISDSKCERQQRVLLTTSITEEDWKTYKVEFKPNQDSYYIFMEALYEEGESRSKGNILIDNMSHITKCDQA